MSTTRTCPVCGNEFKPTGRQIYCSKTCRRKYYHQKYREEEKAYGKQYYQAHRDFYKKYQKKYYRDHIDRFKEYHKYYHKGPNKYCPKPSKEVLRIRRNIINRFKKERPKYPCSAFHESRVARIPDRMCLNCNADRCRFDHDQQ